MEITFSIVGTAGRKDDASKLSKQHFEAMYSIANGLLYQFKEYNYPITHLVSGGAAWADHVAVKLFLNHKFPNLRLFLPAKWENGAFYDNKITGAFQNPGGTSNYYHKRFQNVTNINSLSDIQIAKGEGAELIEVTRGFHARNALIAKSDFILAMTFGHEHEVKDGGTADTIRKYLARVRKEGIFDKSFHYDLNSGKIYIGCKVPPEEKENDKLSMLPGLPTRVKKYPFSQP